MTLSWPETWQKLLGDREVESLNHFIQVDCIQTGLGFLCVRSILKHEQLLKFTFQGYCKHGKQMVRRGITVVSLRSSSLRLTQDWTADVYCMREWRVEWPGGIECQRGKINYVDGSSGWRELQYCLEMLRPLGWWRKRSSPTSALGLPCSCSRTVVFVRDG